MCFRFKRPTLKHMTDNPPLRLPNEKLCRSLRWLSCVSTGSSSEGSFGVFWGRWMVLRADYWFSLLDYKSCGRGQPNKISYTPPPPDPDPFEAVLSLRPVEVVARLKRDPTTSESYCGINKVISCWYHGYISILFQ